MQQEGRGKKLSQIWVPRLSRGRRGRFVMLSSLANKEKLFLPPRLAPPTLLGGKLDFSAQKLAIFSGDGRL